VQPIGFDAEGAMFRMAANTNQAIHCGLVALVACASACANPDAPISGGEYETVGGDAAGQILEDGVGTDAFSGTDGGATGPCEEQYLAISVNGGIVCAPDYPVWGVGPASPTGFTDNGDGTVNHALTGLMWQQAVDSQSYNWSDAGKYCDGLVLGGHDNWRLPTEEELQSIVDFNQESPSISAIAFPSTPSKGFWAATPWIFWTSAWGVSFRDGNNFYWHTSDANRVRCVR
jgi:hypothetical protein